MPQPTVPPPEVLIFRDEVETHIKLDHNRVWRLLTDQAFLTLRQDADGNDRFVFGLVGVEVEVDEVEVSTPSFLIPIDQWGDLVALFQLANQILRHYESDHQIDNEQSITVNGVHWQFEAVLPLEFFDVGGDEEGYLTTEIHCRLLINQSPISVGVLTLAEADIGILALARDLAKAWDAIGRPDADSLQHLATAGEAMSRDEEMDDDKANALQLLKKGSGDILDHTTLSQLPPPTSAVLFDGEDDVLEFDIDVDVITEICSRHQFIDYKEAFNANDEGELRRVMILLLSTPGAQFDHSGLPPRNLTRPFVHLSLLGDALAAFSLADQFFAKQASSIESEADYGQLVSLREMGQTLVFEMSLSTRLNDRTGKRQQVAHNIIVSELIGEAAYTRVFEYSFLEEIDSAVAFFSDLGDLWIALGSPALDKLPALSNWAANKP